MPLRPETIDRLANLPNVTISQGPLLSGYTRFGIGGPAEVYFETSDERSFMGALNVVRSSGSKYVVIGGGTNLIVADAGFPGIVLRFTASAVESEGVRVSVAAGAELQALVDYCIGVGLRGLETMSGIPGSVGAGIYGNAGAYGHSIKQRIREVRFLDGAKMSVFQNAACQFRYRESVFKRHKDWIILNVGLAMDDAP